MNQLKEREIVYANLTLLLKEATKKDKASTVVLKGVVYKHENGYYKPSYKNDDWDRLKLKEPLKVLEVEIIVSLGYANK